MMSAQNDRTTPVPVDPEDAVTDFLAVAELLNEPRLARLYTFVLRNGPVGVEEIKDDLDFAHSTAYKYVDRLEELGVLVRHDEERPTTVTVDPVRVLLATDHGTVAATPVLLAAVARQLDDDDVRVFVERQGVPKLAAALHYAIRIANGELTQRTAANKLDVHPVEGTTVFTALQDVVEAAADYDPYLDISEE